MPGDTDHLAPIAVGGLGGSGTRVFAATLKDAGFSIGPTLNKALDNLWFTVLFKRQTWVQAHSDPKDIAVSIDLFQRAMTTGLRGHVSDDERVLIDQLCADLPPNGAWKCGANASHAEALIESGPQPGGQGRAWGWKEPNTHLFLPHLDQKISGLRYIHVVRNGLDMAFSNNTWQADHWAHYYGLSFARDVPRPTRQLTYWIAANRRVIEYGQTHMQGRFLVMDYDDFCTRSEKQWPRLQQFLGCSLETPMPDNLLNPSTIGRSDAQDLSIFSDALLRKARDMQLAVEFLSKNE